jgi:hypothetical protein
MYASVRKYAGNPRVVDILLKHDAEIRRIIGGIEGLRAYYLIRTEDGGVSVSVFRNQGGAEASALAAADYIREKIPELAGNPPEVWGGEVEIDF